MASRDFPFSPRTTSKLELGDLVAVPGDDGRWRCLQVTDLMRSGPGSRSSLVVGPLPWVGDHPPRRDDVQGFAVTQQGLTTIELFTEGGLRVVDTTPVVRNRLASNFRHFKTGTVHNVWGWRTAVRKATDYGS